MPPSPRNPKPPALTTRLLEIAQRLPLFLSQDRQPFVICPSTATAHPLYSPSFSDWLLQAAQQHLRLTPAPQQIGRVVSILDAEARAAGTIKQVHTRTAKIAPRHYQIDLGHPDHSTIEITGRKWSIGHARHARHARHPRLARFHRIATATPLPLPQPTIAPLPKYLQLIYGISEVDAHKLAHWLGQALLPDQTPPLLMITGKANREAATQLRTWIDPAFHALMPLPYNRSNFAQHAVKNRVLAYYIGFGLSKKKVLDFREMRRGTHARLRHSNPKFNRLFTTIHRPVIVAAEEKQKICNRQLTIEINKSHQVAHAEILGPILDVAVQIVGQPTIHPQPLPITAQALPHRTPAAPPHTDTS